METAVKNAIVEYKEVKQDIIIEKVDKTPQKTCFTISAYYSPLPGQSFYTTRSYTGDKRLNGNGTHFASGKAVYANGIAAPKNYKFGTKIEIEGVIYTVEDRGGAIVNAGVRGNKCDRLDLYMGKGEEALRRALKFGKRQVYGVIL